jgi:hypothetical protein
MKKPTEKEVETARHDYVNELKLQAIEQLKEGYFDDAMATIQNIKDVLEAGDGSTVQ